MTATLLYQTHSPYARKVLVFAHEAGLATHLTPIHQETSPTLRNEEVFAVNPAGQVPVLVRADAPPIFDSVVICDYLDGLHNGRRLIPIGGEARWRALRTQSVAQGLADFGISLRWEIARRPEAFRYAPLREGYTAKLDASYDWLERELETDGNVDVGHIAVATVLDWLEFRELPSFRNRPRLSRWFDEFAARPSMQATPLSGDTHDRPRDNCDPVCG